MNAVPLAKTGLRIRHGTSADGNRILPLIYFEPYVHQQPGWRPILDYITPPSVFLLLEQDDRPQAVWLASIEEDEKDTVSWLRLFAVAYTFSPQEAWAQLWGQALSALRQAGVQRLYALGTKGWLNALLEKSGFWQVTTVRNLAWQRQPLPPRPSLPADITLRPMEISDLKAALTLDRSAFPSPWKMTAPDIERVFQEATASTVAVSPQGIVGYHISTSGVRGGHLARLAVHPRAQRRGIGYALVYDALTHFVREGAEWVTVNTWSDNVGAIRLYHRFGFHFLPEAHPLYCLDLASEGI